MNTRMSKTASLLPSPLAEWHCRDMNLDTVLMYRVLAGLAFPGICREAAGRGIHKVWQKEARHLLAGGAREDC
jgi:hypothetical protein